MSDDERLREYAKRLLRQLMEDISEDHYCAGWMMNLELNLWRMVEGGPRGYGMGDVSEEQVEQLRQLSKDAGGRRGRCSLTRKTVRRAMGAGSPLSTRTTITRWSDSTIATTGTAPASSAASVASRRGSAGVRENLKGK